uniref:Uncharacterized protein n=1 Tax=Tetranychus urticae TaxID=32264 RepID=T1KKU2_TETUR
MEFNSAKKCEISFTEPDVEEAYNLGRYKHSQVELEECRNRIEELKFHHDEEKAEAHMSTINSLENIVMMLMLKTKNSADHASRLEEKTYPSSNNKPTTSRKSDIEPYSSHSEEVNINMSSKNLASSIMGPRQAWMDTDLSLEDASLIEAIDAIARDCEKDREMNNLTGLISHQDKYASSGMVSYHLQQTYCAFPRYIFTISPFCLRSPSRLEKRLQELKSENDHLRSHRDFMLRRLIEGDYRMNTGKTKKVNKEAENTETRVKRTTTIENEILVSTDTPIKLDASSDVKTDSSELCRALEKEKTEIKDVSDKTDKPVDKNVAKANEPHFFDKFKPLGSWVCTKCITGEKSKKNHELRLASKASQAQLNEKSIAHFPPLIIVNPLASDSETSKIITLTSSSSSTSTSSTPTTASSSLAFGKSTDSNKNLIMSTGSLGESSQTKISSSNRTKPISTTDPVSRDETACTAAKLTSGSTSSAGTTSTSGFTFGQTPKTTQSSSSGLFFSSTSSNAPSSLASPGIQSNAFGQSSTFSFSASPSTSQAKQPASP